MAIAKVILNGETLMDVTSDTVEANKLLSGETATKNNGTKVTGTYVAPDPVISSLTVTPTESTQTFNAAAVSGYKPVTVGAIASDYVGSAIPLKSAADLSVNGSYITTPMGYYSSEVSAYISSGSVWQGVASIFTPEPSSFELISSTGYIRYIMPSTTVSLEFGLSSGYISNINGLHNDFILKSDSGTRILDGLHKLSAKTYTPTESIQYISSYQWLTGSQTIAAIPSSYIIPSGTYSISSNGTYNIGSYSSVSVDVSAVGSDPGFLYGDVIHLSGSTGTNNWTRLSWDYTENDFSNFCSQMSGIPKYLFAGKEILGSIQTMNFPNVTTIESCAFYHVSTIPMNNSSVWCRTISLPNCKLIGSKAFNNMHFSNIFAPLCSIISSEAFANCSLAGAVDFPNVSRIEELAFCKCKNMSTINIPSCKSIGSFAFSYCTKLAYCDLPICENISGGAFYYCQSMSYINVPNIKAVPANAFAGCKMLSSIDIPNCVAIYASAFAYCSQLSEIIGPKVSRIEQYAFYCCTALKTIDFPICTNIGEKAFQSCKELINVNIPECQNINASTFANCENLQTVTLPKTKYLAAYAFRSCYNLLSLYLSYSSVVSLDTTVAAAFSSTPIAGYTASTGGEYGKIYVPASLYDAYLSDNKWRIYSSQIISV